METLNLSTATTGTNSIVLTPEMEAKIIEQKLTNKFLQPNDISDILKIDFTSSTRSLIRKNIKVTLTEDVTVNSVSDLTKNFSKLDCFGNLTKLDAFGFRKISDGNHKICQFIFVQKPNGKQTIKSKKQ